MRFLTLIGYLEFDSLSRVNDLAQAIAFISRVQAIHRILTSKFLRDKSKLKELHVDMV